MPAPIVAVIGATATGKTALAIELARRLGAEIINADSRQVYRGMDIGTAKPTKSERGAAQHWLIDVADPSDTFSLGMFLDLANEARRSIESRSRLVILAGGTGQYIWSFLEGWSVPPVPPDTALRAELESLVLERGSGAIIERLRSIDPVSAEEIDARNTRRAIRAIEVTLATGRPFSDWQTKTPLPDVRIIGLRLERDDLYGRIDTRVDSMLAAGFVEEVSAINAKGYGCELASMDSIGYRQICGHLRGETTLAEAVAQMKTETHRLARMQATWFKATDPRIAWLPADDSTVAERALSEIETE